MAFDKLKIFIALPVLAFSSMLCTPPKYININDTFDTKIQPKEAFKIAEPFLEEHATYNWKPEKPLKTHIVKYRRWYYFKRTNYPAKTTRYYLQPAVRVHVKTGEVSFTKK